MTLVNNLTFNSMYCLETIYIVTVLKALAMVFKIHVPLTFFIKLFSCSFVVGVAVLAALAALLSSFLRN